MPIFKGITYLRWIINFENNLKKLSYFFCTFKSRTNWGTFDEDITQKYWKYVTLCKKFKINVFSREIYFVIIREYTEMFLKYFPYYL